ncbi:AAA family ATPase [Streptomyces sp. AV19]|uniref:AAA family ATPase n=1 Tax=Streptomyces sp. AV19 TaxID=2793068 RepID=UPI0024138ECC|nr:AAA family ATPase [Streptomyces sp. AV19]MDG4533906.1 ATP-binding protein [Streptomyces sp. AV19]
MGAGDDIGGTTAPAGQALCPRGLVDLRGHKRGPEVLAYPPGAVVVVSGLPGSGKSTLLRRWSGAGRVVDPRDVHVACESAMPDFLPYAAYRPWARVLHFLRLRTGVRAGGPLLVHDCGSRAWMRRWLGRAAGRLGRELHLVLLDVGPAEALAGQHARGRSTRPHVFARHRRGLSRLLSALPAPGTATRGRRPVPPMVAEAASVVLLDRTTREHVRVVTFGAA